MNFDQADELNEAIRTIGLRHRALAIEALAPLGIHPGHKVLLLELESEGPRTQAQLAGASGYVVKDIKGMELAQAIKDVGAGKSLLDNRAAAALMAKLRGAAERTDPLLGLTDQERTLLGLLSEGLTNKQIAARMFLAEKTVKNYVSRLLAKLGMERRTQAAVFASKLDTINRPDR